MKNLWHLLQSVFALNNAKEVIPDEDELNALKAYYSHDPEYQPSISQEDLLKELGIDID